MNDKHSVEEKYSGTIWMGRMSIIMNDLVIKGVIPIGVGTSRFLALKSGSSGVKVMERCDGHNMGWLG